MGRISMPQGKGSQMHNRRDYEKLGYEVPDNIDSERTPENVTFVDKDVREAYEEIFGDAVERYNEKQKREDRKITDYYEKIEHSKNGEKLFYEDVLQWGKKEDFEGNEQLREKAKEALTEYAKTFQERNPNLHVIGAYIHMDEASPHLHLDYVPVAHGYSRGMDTRNSLDKALEKQGIEVKERRRTVKDKETGENIEVELDEGRYNNRTMAWKEREREYFGEICKELGLEVEAERNINRKQLSVGEYKEIMAEVDGEIDRQKEYIEAMKEGGAYTNEQGEHGYIDYEDSIRHLENTREHLTENAFAYKNGGWYYDYDRSDGFAIPDGGIEQSVKDAEAKAEQITRGAETEAERITGEATAEADKILAQASEQLDYTKNAIQKNNGIIQGQIDRYRQNETSLNQQADRISQKQAQLDNLDKELTAKAASVERISQSFDRIAERVPEHDAPEPVIKSRKVIDQEKGFMREEVSHKEYSVSIPAGSLEDAQALQREIGDLYTKHYAKEGLKGLTEASERQAKEQADKMLADAQERIRQAENVLQQQQQIIAQANQQAQRTRAKAEADKTAILEQAEAERVSILGQAKEQLQSMAEVDKKLSPQELTRMLDDSTVTNLVQETMLATCKQLEERGLLGEDELGRKVDAVGAFSNLNRNKIIDNMKDRVEDFIDKVKDHIQELTQNLAEVVHHRTR